MLQIIVAFGIITLVVLMELIGMGSPNSKRILVPVSEREKETIKLLDDSNNIKSFSKNKVSEWLAEPNTKAFNKILLEKAFHQHLSITDSEVLKVELAKYFQTCYDKNVVPTISTLCVWLGVNRDTIYSNIASKGVNSDVLQLAVNLCHSFVESGAIAGSINSVLFMFLGKNYYSMNDNSTINLTSTLTDNTINNTNTMKVIQEQILEEQKENKLL